jgi:hypothetical protein
LVKNDYYELIFRPLPRHFRHAFGIGIAHTPNCTSNEPPELLLRFTVGFHVAPLSALLLDRTSVDPGPLTHPTYKLEPELAISGTADGVALLLRFTGDFQVAPLFVLCLKNISPGSPG